MGTRTDRASVVEVIAPSTEVTSATGPGDPQSDKVPAAPDEATIPSTRAGRTWIRVLPALVLLAVTVVFVLQNLRSAKVSFITASGRLPLGLALLMAAALGALVVLALGSIRIVQLRHLVRRTTRRRRATTT
jgi:uncharacterized integral membrane protein